jgi:hypothetical protein
MGFEPSRRIGSLWNDAIKVDGIIRSFPFYTTGKSEKAFEANFSSHLMADSKIFENDVITQIDKTKKVKSVYCFGKNNRPDLTIGEDGLAFEIKYIDYGSLNAAIGQGFIYRLDYKFVFLILVLSEDAKELYYEIAEGKEKQLEDILKYLSEDMSIFTYIVPSFEIKKVGVTKCIPFINIPPVVQKPQNKTGDVII